MQQGKNAFVNWGMLLTGILLSEIETIFVVGFYLTFIFKILSSTALNNILSFSSPQIFAFLIFTFVNICQNEVLSEESQLMKWVRIFWVGISWVGIFQGGIFQGGSLMGENFPSGNFPGGDFPRTIFDAELKMSS